MSTEHMGFWPDEIWAQEEGAAEPPAGTLFTRAESTPFDTASRLVVYTLSIPWRYVHAVGRRPGDSRRAIA